MLSYVRVNDVLNNPTTTATMSLPVLPTVRCHFRHKAVDTRRADEGPNVLLCEREGELHERTQSGATCCHEIRMLRLRTAVRFA